MLPRMRCSSRKKTSRMDALREAATFAHCVYMSHLEKGTRDTNRPSKRKSRSYEEITLRPNDSYTYSSTREIESPAVEASFSWNSQHVSISLSATLSLLARRCVKLRLVRLLYTTSSSVLAALRTECGLQYPRTFKLVFIRKTCYGRRAKKQVATALVMGRRPARGTQAATALVMPRRSAREKQGGKNGRITIRKIRNAIHYTNLHTRMNQVSDGLDPHRSQQSFR